VPKNIYVPKSLDEELLTDGYQLSCFIDNNLDMSDEDQTSSIMSNRTDKIEYDEDTKSLVEDSTIVTADCTLSDMDTSAGNASMDSEPYCCKMEVEEPRFNYHGPKVMLPKYESPVTICTADTIGSLRSRRLFRVLLDSGSTVSMIKRSALPEGVLTKEISQTKIVRTLAGKLKTQEAVTMQDLHLPKLIKIGK